LIKLSIIIVNYNVRHFLDQCLASVYRSLKDIPSEVFVVDNHSFDGSCGMVKQKYPQVQLICNEVNYGFAKANNQAIRMSKGEYILLLNPDTLVQEDTFEKVVAFMDGHPEAGGLGVKMIDGKGNFLPESKRGLPTPSVAFYKIFGLSRIFPKSKTFGRYHLTFLDKDKVHEIDVLSGAFMLLRKSTLDKTGLLDEDYFMYGEDIDLSYCITKAGYKNYYFPETTIIHYKGESTKKTSINYVIIFYKAMLIFARKHFSSRYAALLSFFIYMAVYFRAFAAIIYRALISLLYPLLDFTAIYGGILIIKDFWEKSMFGTENYYPPVYVYYILPAYVIFWLFTIYFLGGYGKPVRIVNILKGLMWGLIPILVFYALLPEDLRFSRAILLLGFSSAVICLPLYRFILSLTGLRFFALNKKGEKRIVVVSAYDEFKRVSEMIREILPNPVIVGYISTENNGNQPELLGNTANIYDIVKSTRPDEIIFCSANIPTQAVIEKMLVLSAMNIDFKIANPDSIAIVGSNSIHSAGDLYVIENNSISKPLNQRLKRMLDILFCIFGLTFLILLIAIVKKPGNFIANIFSVLIGSKTWVGFYPLRQEGLPLIRKAVLPPYKISNFTSVPENIDMINLTYARNYKVTNDIYLFFNNIRNWGNKM